MIEYILIYVIIVISAVMAVTARKLLNSAIMLAILSIGITIILFKYNAPWAAVFELSVAAGLITVLFVSAVSLVKDKEDEIKEKRIKYTLFPLIAIIFVLLSAITVPDYMMNLFSFAAQTPGKQEPIGKLIWLYRGMDIIGQITILTASVFVIKHILPRTKKEVK